LALQSIAVQRRPSASRQRDHDSLTNNGGFAMNFFAKFVRKHPGTPRCRDAFVPRSFDPPSTILRAGECGGHGLALYFWALSRSI